MAAYGIGMVRSINDPKVYAEYQGLAGPTVEKYGGKFVLGGNKIEVADGDWSPISVVVVEFESMARMKEWYNSPEYSAIKGMRTSSTDCGLIFIDGS